MAAICSSTAAMHAIDEFRAGLASFAGLPLWLLIGFLRMLPLLS